MPSVDSVIGLDIGHSAVKVSCCTSDEKERQIIFPSIAVPAFNISDEGEARRASRETVNVGSRPYFFGETARTQGGTATGLSEDWVDTPEHLALMKGALKRVQDEAGLKEDAMLVLGLPTHLFARQRDRLKQLASQVHPKGEVKVVPQPFAPFQMMMLDRYGNASPIHSMMEESWGVIEVGYYSTDFMLMQRGRWVEKASGSCAGVRVAADHLARMLGEKGLTADLPECEEALQTRKLLNFGKKTDVGNDVDQSIALIVTEVIDTATRLMEPFVRRLDGVLVAGGGAPIIHPAIQDKWPHAHLAHKPRFAVAEGMRRFGLALLRARELHGISA